MELYQQVNIGVKLCDRYYRNKEGVRPLGVAVAVEEVRVVDEKTGAEKGSKVERFDLIPNEFERALARHYGVGARKYADRNWERGYKWSLSVAALRRHLAQWLDGEDNDSETGSNHLIAVAWHAIALFIFQLRGVGTDDVRQARPAKARFPQSESDGEAH